VKYSVFTVSMPVYTPAEGIAKLKELGYDGIEWRIIDQPPSEGSANFWQGNKCTLPLTGLVEQAESIRKQTAEGGLEVSGAASYVRCDDVENAEKALRGAKALGASQVRISVPSYDGIEPFKPLWDAAKEQYKTIATLAREVGIKALIECHHRSITPSASSARYFLDGLDPEWVGAIHDAGNMVHEGYEAYRMGLEILGPYLAHVHAKNARWFPKGYRGDAFHTIDWMCDWATIPKGIVDYYGFFKALHAVGYDGWIAIEDFSTEIPLDDRLANNLTYLKDLEARTRAGA
jgi:sugar phosphate isomerase/epimerase